MQCLGNSRPAVLVVDDEEMVRNLLRAALEREGFEVRLAVSGREALSLCEYEGTTFAAVLLDVRMPGLDGPQTLSEMRRIMPDTPCCFMSGNPGHYEGMELLDRGAVALFAKPFRLNHVAEVLWQLVRAERGRTEAHTTTRSEWLRAQGSEDAGGRHTRTCEGGAVRLHR
jgi:DNA-binding NtrC family response regulator